MLLDSHENLSPGLTREWRHGGQLAIYRIRSLETATIDSYVDSVVEQVRLAEPRSYLFFIKDVAFPEFYLTPHLRMRLMEMADVIRRHEVYERTAIILPRNRFSTITNLFINLNERRTQWAYLHRSYHMGDALKWVETQMSEAGIL